ncbi:MAG: hypothetical protein M3N97_11700, partial [Pseudomonadota bacterium]|nr:hypothetical protein [Pseudomonadota bacterium]
HPPAITPYPCGRCSPTQIGLAVLGPVVVEPAFCLSGVRTGGDEYSAPTSVAGFLEKWCRKEDSNP